MPSSIELRSPFVVKQMCNPRLIELTTPPSKIERFKTYLESLKDSKETLDAIAALGTAGKSAYVLVGNTHQCVLVSEEEYLWNAFRAATLITSDSQILALTYRLLLGRKLEIIRGWELTLLICRVCQVNRFPIALYGGTEETLTRLKKRLREDFPELNVVATISPPFRPLQDQEKLHFQNLLQESGAKVVLVGLGCPKQEIWMLENSSHLKAVSIGVGAAFDFLSGNTKCSPKWIHQLGFEWLWRLLNEPKRLFSRYFRFNLKFTLICADFLSKKRA